MGAEYVHLEEPLLSFVDILRYGSRVGGAG